MKHNFFTFFAKISFVLAIYSANRHRAHKPAKLGFQLTLDRLTMFKYGEQGRLSSVTSYLVNQSLDLTIEQEKIVRLDGPTKTFEIISDPEMLSDIKEATFEALERLGLGGKRPAAGQCVAAVDIYIAKLLEDRLQGESDDDFEEEAFVLGCLWGSQLVSAFGWEWIKVKFDHSTFVIGVASPQQNLIIYPFLFLLECLEGERPLTVYRSFQVLSEPGRVPELPPGSLENVMDHIE